MLTTILENIALRKPSKASHTTGGSHIASYANDGDGNTYFIGRGDEDRSWVVDLGDRFWLGSISAVHPGYSGGVSDKVCYRRSHPYKGMVSHTIVNKKCLVSSHVT